MEVMNIIIRRIKTNEIIQIHEFKSFHNIHDFHINCYLELSLKNKKIKIYKTEDDFMTLYKSNYQIGGYENLQLAIN